ncbi:hypothetical protein [Telmatospirillum sp.]|uniref:hypothetical protein n=1 Tax=Telmatospirillum sp. TaxID=2079197 RepID=UPI00283B301D|nr:hypothetical protein [Telmatospirillum sp.]MDR3437807.1 hypothetical protein [Telmatospirillum sp.]
MRKVFLALLFLAICPLLLAQQALNNDAVVKLVKAGLSDDLIVSTINSQAGTYDTSTDGLIALKTAGVSDKVVAAMVAKAAAPPPAPPAPVAPPAPAAPPPPPPPPPVADPDDPMTPHDPGVYLLTAGHDGKQKMVFIDRAGAGREKTANVWGYAFTYGISKAKIKAEVPGPHAPVRAKDARPVFYMFFPSAANLGGFGGNDVITSPAQFSLLSMEEKKDHRETAVAKMGLASASAGTDDKRTKLFSTDRIRNGVYKITPNTDLAAGEYAFIASSGVGGAATTNTVVIYDFGVDLR